MELLVGPLVFRKSEDHSIIFGPFRSILAIFEPKYLRNGLKFYPLVFCTCFVSILSHFSASLVKISIVVGEKMAAKNSKNARKIENWPFSSQIFTLKTTSREKSDESSQKGNFS